MNNTKRGASRRGTSREIFIHCIVAALGASLLGCAASSVRPNGGDGGDSGSDNDVTMSSSTDAAPVGPACLPTSAPTCGDVLPQARLLYDFEWGPPAQAPGGTPVPGCYLARKFALLGGAFGYGPTSMRVLSTGATTRVLQIRSEQQPGSAPFRIDFEYDAATPTNLLVARCPLDGFGTGRHRLAVRPDGSIELHWLENDRVTGYMIFSQCAPTATGGCS